ncbi:MAG: hypothetical protein IPL46_23700 [Saprospiraceae bacterium]|nr:hypothetical protein [Saprospiraceae bacterium]
MINNFYHVARKISNENGLKINSESGGPGFPLHNVPVEPLKSLGVMDLPRGEFWINHSRLNDDGIDILRVVKEVSSASHIYGKRIVEEEAFTTFQQWQEGPFEMKPSGDRAFCEGMNKVVVHGSSHNPRGYGYPGIVYGAGTHFNDRRVWWKKIRPFNEYLARISYVAQEGDFVADVLYYYGDAIPNYTGHKNSRFIVGPGYDYEVINTDILKQLRVQGQSLMLPTGASLKMLVLQSEQEINPEVFQKLQELAEQGAMIISDKPEKVLMRRNLPELRYTSDEIDGLWLKTGIEKFDPIQNRGKVFSGVTPVEVLNYLQIPPDFTYADAPFFLLDYIHYQKETFDFYFIRNTTDAWLNRMCSFRQMDKKAEFWNPIDGSIAPVLIQNQRGEYTDIPISLPPFGSAFVAFSPGEAKGTFTGISPTNGHLPRMEYSGEDLFIWEPGNFKIEVNGGEMNFTSHLKTLTLEGAWEVFFPEGWGAPKRVVFHDLMSWTDSKIEGVQYFSGTATYRKTFQMDINSALAENQQIYLDLGDLTNVAEVWLNEKPLGVIWAKPYRFEVTGAIKPGDNLLVVEVANTWSNRLKGDAITGEQFTHTNITNTNVAGLNKIRLPWAEVPLIKAGLFGPVTLQTIIPIR